MDNPMQNASNQQDLGDTEVQWYKKDPMRLEEEIRLMKEVFPFFSYEFEKNGNLLWSGNAKIKKNEKIIYSLNIKIECPIDYPIVFPRAYDLDGILSEKKCPHLIENSNGPKGICYGNRIGGELDFLNSSRIKDVVNQVCIFLARQWYFEKNGRWPDGQPHGHLAFLEYEISHNTIPPDDLCPCGMHNKNYRSCHMKLVNSALFALDSTVSNFFGGAQRIERNELCPCGNEKKFKKCCMPNINYPSSKTFLLLKYPESFGLSEDRRNQILKTLIYSFENISK